MRVLVVEDEPRLGEMVRRGLVAEGFVVELAHTGPEGLHQGTEGGFDVPEGRSAELQVTLYPWVNAPTVCMALRGEFEAACPNNTTTPYGG